MDNIIYVSTNENDEWRLKFPKYNIEAKAYIGKNGTTKNKKEGDGKTPLGSFELGRILGTQKKINNRNSLEYQEINENMYWIDDSKSKYYNQLVDISKIEKDWNSAEHLIEYKTQYEYLIEIRTNPNNIPGIGSAIFLHCSNNKATAGCVAVSRDTMEKILENIDKNTKMEIQ